MTVIFRHQNEEFVLQKEEIGLKRYHQQNVNESVIDFVTNEKHEYVQMFFSFLKNGDVPLYIGDQIPVFQILKEWGGHFSLFDSFRHRIDSKSMNGIIMHQNQSFDINKGSFCFNSSVFQEFYVHNPYGVFCVDHPCSRASFVAFLDLIHNRIILPELEDTDEVLELCRLFGCSSLCALLNEKSPEAILSYVLRKQQDDCFDFEYYEQLIRDNIESYLQLADFGKLCIPSLCHIFQKSKKVFRISQLRSFFEQCAKYHGYKALIILNMLQFPTADNIEELSDFLGVFSDVNNGTFLSQYNFVLKDFLNQFNNMRNLNLDKDQRIDSLEKEQYELILQLRKKEIEDEQVVLCLMGQIETLSNQLLKMEQEAIRKEESRKEMEEYERIGKWKSIKAPDFVEDIFEAAKIGKLSSIVYLLNNGISVEFQDPSGIDWHNSNWTALHYSSRYGHLDIVEYLISQGANVNAKSKFF